MQRRFRFVRRFLALVRADPAGVRAGFGALMLSSAGDLVAGLTLGSITGTLEALPGLLVLVPAAIGMRGNVFGALGSRLGTLIHQGDFRISTRRDTAVGQNLTAAMALSFSVALVLAVAARIVTVAFGVAKSISVLDFLVISVVGALISSTVVLVITVGVASLAARRGWDLDNVAAPIVTAAGDMVTLPSLFLATYLVGHSVVTPVIGAVCIAIGVVSLVLALRSRYPVLRRIARESFPVLVIAGIVDIIAGLTIEKRFSSFLTYPALLVLVPPFLEDSGSLGGILSARVATKLHLGLVEPSRNIGSVIEDVMLIFVYAVPVFLLLGVSADIAAAVAHLHSPGALAMIAVSLLAGMVATTFAVLVGYYGAVATFRLGMDPDSHGIPIVCSSLDLFGAVSLILVIVALGLT